MFNANQFHNMRSYYESKHEYTNTINIQSKIDVQHSSMKQKGMFIHTHSSLRSSGYGVPVYVSKDGKKRLVIKTTVAILDTGTFKHQCVTMRTKDFRECLFLKRFLCIEAVVKRFTFQNQAYIRLKIDQVLSKNIDW